MHAHIRYAGLVLWLQASLAAAAPAPSDSKEAAALCTHTSMTAEDIASGTQPLFPQIRAAALEVRRVLCIEGGTREAALAQFTSFVVQLGGGKWFEPFGGFQSGRDPLLGVRTALETAAPIPTIGSTFDPNAIEVQGDVFAAAMPDLCDRLAGGEGCAGALVEFRQYYNYAQNTLASEGARHVAQTVSGLSKQWAAYLDSSRSFTPLELLINSALYKRDATRQFSAPPATQWIVLHPSIVVENVSDAVGGEQAKEALMVELAGINRWQQAKWYLPTGGSIAAIYADRPGVTELGYGVALHFRSLYSIGYSRHGSDSGVFVSFDLLKLLQDKRKMLAEFKP